MRELEEAIDKEISLYRANEYPDWETTKKLRREKRTLSLGFIADGLNYCCGVATQEKMDSMYMEEGKLEAHITALHDTMEDTLKMLSTRSEDQKRCQEETNQAIRMTESKIHNLEEFVNKEQLEKEWATEMVQANMEANLGMANRIILLVRKMRSQAALQECKQKQIPLALIKPETLLSHLKKIKGEIRKNEFELAISTAQVSSYFRLPISECTFSDGLLVVHVKIPLISLNRKWRLFQLVTNPFAWEGQTCTIKHAPLMMAVATTRTRTIPGSRGIKHRALLVHENCSMGQQ